MTSTPAPTPVTQDELQSAAWSACDSFRGTVEPAVYKDHVLALFFLKHLSDLWQDHHDSYQRQYGDHPALIEEMLKSERFVLPPEASFHALHAQRHAPGNGERIDKALRALEDANLAKLRDLFQDAHFNSGALGHEQHRNSILRHLLEDLARPTLNLRPSRLGSPDMAGNAFEFLIRSFAIAIGRQTGAFYTPPEVAGLIARLMEPQPGEDICDPACGSGSLLMQCARLVRERSGVRQYALYGQEAASSTWALGRMNLFVHGEDNHRIEWGDTLRNPRLLDSAGHLQRFDIVLSAPPFSQDNWGHDAAQADPHGRFRRGMPPRSKSDYAFVQHMVETMKPGTGRMAVVMPHGVLFRGAAEARIRQKLVEENLLDAVIGLPEKLFYNTAMPAALLVLRMSKKDSQVLFIDASGHCDTGKTRNRLRESDIQRILDTALARRSEAGYACLASPQQIAQNDFNLNIARYVDASPDRPVIDRAALKKERQDLKAELAMLEEQMQGYLVELGYA